jgi:RNA polymerase sigma factor (sigma-70 family)
MQAQVVLALLFAMAGRCPSHNCDGYRVSIAIGHHDFYVEATWDASCKLRGEANMKGNVRQDDFEAILLEYDGPLRRLANAYEKDAFLQKDLIQEIRLAIWRALPSFRGQSSERTFIYRIAHNRALTHVAKRHPEQLDMEMALELPDISPDPESLAVQRWQRAELHTRIASLPLTLRQVVTLALEGLSNLDISQVLGISEGNVAVRLTRAKKQLRSGGVTYE